VQACNYWKKWLVKLLLIPERAASDLLGGASSEQGCCLITQSGSYRMFSLSTLHPFSTQVEPALRLLKCTKSEVLRRGGLAVATY